MKGERPEAQYLEGKYGADPYLRRNYRFGKGWRLRKPELVNLLAETVCSVWKTIRIAGDDYPAELVKSRLMKLDSTHIEFVFDQ